MNDNQTAATILITVYNCHDYIAASINSALAQTDVDFKVLVINDGSTDRSKHEIDAIDDPRLMVCHCERMGRIKALNFGLRQCATKYVAILDADDLSFPHRLALQSQFLDTNERVAIVDSKYRPIIDADGNQTEEHILPTTSYDIIQMMKTGRHPLFHSSVMFRLEAVMELGGYDESLSCYEDLDLYAKIGKRWELANINERLSLKRLHSRQFFGAQDGVIFTPYGRDSGARVLRRITKAFP